MDGLDEITMEFLIESREFLDQLDRDLVIIEQSPEDEELIARIFRAVHTIKGTCGFLGFSKLEKITHVGENLLTKLRDGKIKCTPQLVTALLQLCDSIRTIIDTIEETGKDGELDYNELAEHLTTLLDNPSAEMPGSAVSVPVEAAAEIIPPTQEAAPEPEKPLNQAQPVAAESTIRVDVSLLDNLMNIVGELVLARNQILQYSLDHEDSLFIATTQRLNLITAELQASVMKTRMQPIGNVWNKFPRLVRDVSLTCGKKIKLEMEGKETDLDKTLLEAIKDPLTHLVRNAVDHGIEIPDQRKSAGKPEEGCLILRAFHEGGQVNIEICDDGGGIDPEIIRAKAIEKGLVTSEQAQSMTERDIVSMILLPGFSTAAKVTNISGRGVGMDVVKTNIDSIGGTIEIQSKKGVGTTFVIKIPLTLAIVPALIVRSCNQRFAIPQVSLVELLRIEGSQAEESIEWIKGVPVYRLRGELLPLVYLNKELKLSQDEEKSEDIVLNIAVLTANGRQFGLVVDSINDSEEIVVKPLSRQLKDISAFAGSTIMGDGKAALILDVSGIAQRANVVTELNERVGRRIDEDQDAGAQVAAKEALLIFRNDDEDLMAMTLSSVARLEDIEVSQLEKSGNCDVVQYRGGIMPLIYLDKALGINGDSVPIDEHTIQVVVYTNGVNSIGLVVGTIVDIAEEVLNISQSSEKEGVLGSAVIQGHVTEVINMEELIRLSYPSFFIEAEVTSMELSA